ncbi:MAG: type I DNA topoisomerase [Gemmatimonadetes bacterium]|nr:type I DNA topoisomerase [Gemmatimonadota bacterium]
MRRIRRRSDRSDSNSKREMVTKKKTAKKPTATTAADTTSAETPKAAAKPKAAPKAKVAAKPKAAAKAKAAAKSAARKRVAALEDTGSYLAPGVAAAMTGRSLVIVESPAKAKTIGKYLGSAYAVKATVGHIRDLPTKTLGIDLTDGFEPEYVTIPGKEKIVAELKQAAKGAKAVYIATDPDREGEAIAWHVQSQIKGKGTGVISRVLFHEITKEAVTKAIESAGEIDTRKVDAQQARRVLDRLVGYKASPVLWKTVKKGLSAGRVQTVALRLLVEREREIRAFNAVEYWSIAATLMHDGQEFTAKLHHVDGKKPEIPTADAADRIVNDVGARKTFDVTDIKRRERRKNPAEPFKTSTLQQEAAKKLGFGSKRTMRLAQNLYEGIELGRAEGAVGLITYMRTPDTRVALSAVTAAREFLVTQYPKEFLAPKPMLYGAPGDADSPHEGVRPTDPARTPESVQQHLSPEQFKLYTLIWQRFMASQMAPAVFDTTTVDFDIEATRRYLFRATGSVVKFLGYQALYKETREEGEGKALEDEQALPAIEPGEHAPVVAVTPAQHFTQPPPRFSEASLVKELERLGIGRPSTYASIISTLTDRHYAELEQRRFFPTAMGESVEKVMVKQFPNEFNVGFTAGMEAELDKVEEGKLGWQSVLKEFWGPFDTALSTVDYEGLIQAAHDLSALATEKCPTCAGKLVAKGGFFGPFVACENHPKTCKYTRPLKGECVPPTLTEHICPLCAKQMVTRRGRSGEFLGCSAFPKCRGTRSMPTGVKCPKDGGDIAARRSKKRGKAFYGCENYPKCDFVCWDKPVLEKCPECGNIGAESKSNRTRGTFRRCLKCANEWSVTEPAETADMTGG